MSDFDEFFKYIESKDNSRVAQEQLDLLQEGNGFFQQISDRISNLESKYPNLKSKFDALQAKLQNYIKGGGKASEGAKKEIAKDVNEIIASSNMSQEDSDALQTGLPQVANKGQKPSTSEPQNQNLQNTEENGQGDDNKTKEPSKIAKAYNGAKTVANDVVNGAQKVGNAALNGAERVTDIGAKAVNTAANAVGTVLDSTSNVISAIRGNGGAGSKPREWNTKLSSYGSSPVTKQGSITSTPKTKKSSTTARKAPVKSNNNGFTSLTTNS